MWVRERHGVADPQEEAGGPPTELNRYGDQAPISPGAPAAVARFGSSLGSASVRASLRRTGQMGSPW